MNRQTEQTAALVLAGALCLLSLTGCCQAVLETDGQLASKPVSDSSQPLSGSVSAGTSSKEEQPEASSPMKETDVSKQTESSTVQEETQSRPHAEESASSILPEAESSPGHSAVPEGSHPLPEVSESASAQAPGPIPEVSDPEPSKPLAPKDQLILLADALKNTAYYKSDIVGTVKASSLYTQDIHDVHIKCGKEAYLRAVSKSSLVNVGKEAFFSGGRVVTRDAENVDSNQWSKNFSVVSLDAYRSANGNTPSELSNYIITKDTVLNASVEKKSDGSFLLKADIDPKKGTALYAVKMKNYGGLKENPVFSSCRIEISFNADKTINTLKSYDVYQIKKGFLKLPCRSELTETFTYTRNVTIPNVQTFRAQL